MELPVSEPAHSGYYIRPLSFLSVPHFCCPISLMEAHNLVSGFSINLKNPLLQTPTKSSSLDFLDFWGSQKWVSLKTQLPLKFDLQRVGDNKGFVCRNSVEKVKGVMGLSHDSGVKRKKLAVFVPGGGSNLRSLHEGTLGGSIRGEIAILVTNKPGRQSYVLLILEFDTRKEDSMSNCGGAEYARDTGIPVVVFPKTTSAPEGLSAVDLVNTLKGSEVDFILLAGYLKLIPVELIRAYTRCIFNIHPSLLPAFGGKGYYGMKVHKAVIASGARYSGPTIHFVDEDYDTGRILAQGVVLLLANETAEELAARVLQEEHQLYVEVASALCEERIVWRQDKVPLIQSRENPDQFN